MNTAGLILVGISGICWTIVYIELIRNGFKDKACDYLRFVKRKMKNPQMTTKGHSKTEPSKDGS